MLELHAGRWHVRHRLHMCRADRLRVIRGSISPILCSEMCIPGLDYSGHAFGNSLCPGTLQESFVVWLSVPKEYLSRSRSRSRRHGSGSCLGRLRAARRGSGGHRQCLWRCRRHSICKGRCAAGVSRAARRGSHLSSCDPQSIVLHQCSASHECANKPLQVCHTTAA